MSTAVLFAFFIATANSGLAPAAGDQSGAAVVEVVGITGPRHTAVVASVQPARIAAISAEEGKMVRAGELLIQLDEAVQAARTQLAAASAENELPVQLARVQWERAQRDLRRIETLRGSELSSSKEFSDAISEADAAKLRYDIAVFEQGQAARAYERDKRLLAEYRIVAPFDGYVIEHLKHPGESVDQLEGIVRVAQLDPLLVTVDCPLSLAGRVREGVELRVRPVDQQWSSRTGKVVLASRVADGASQTFRVKLTVENDGLEWISGMKVVVEFPEQNAVLRGVSQDAR